MLLGSQKDSSHSTFLKHVFLVLPWWSSGKESTFQCGGLGFDPFSGKEHHTCHCVKRKGKKGVFLAFSSRWEGWVLLAMTSALESLSSSRPPTTRPAAACHLGGAQPTADCSRSSSQGGLVSVCPLLSKVLLILGGNADVISLLLFYLKSSKAPPFFLGYCSQGCSWPALDGNFKPHFSALLYTVAPSELLKIFSRWVMLSFSHVLSLAPNALLPCCFPPLLHSVVPGEPS